MTSLEEHSLVRDVETRDPGGLAGGGMGSRTAPVSRGAGALDHFHIGGFRASRVLRELASRAEDRVL